MNQRTHRWLALAAGITALQLGVSAPASAQNALGSGRALDSGLRQGSKLNARGSNFSNRLRYQNSIVNGTSPGGKSFRGVVGHSGSNEFRSDPFAANLVGLSGGINSVGSNNLFSFQRDSAYSSLASRGLRGINALQFESQLARGGGLSDSPNAFLPVIRRPTTGFSSSSLVQSSFGNSSNLNSSFNGGQSLSSSLDAYSLKPGTLRSTSEFLSNSSLAPTVLRSTPGVGAIDTPASFTFATPLRGVVKQMAPSYADNLISSGISTPKSAADLALQNRTNKQVSGFVEPKRTGYENILNNLRTLTQTADTKNESALNAEKTLVRPEASSSFLLGPARSTTPNATSPSDNSTLFKPLPDSEQPTKLTLEDRLAQLRHAMQSSTPLNENDKAQAKLHEQINRTIEILKGASPHVDSLAIETNPHRDFFAEHMHLGQVSLERQQWFTAEEHFSSALSSHPGDTLAAAGRVNAEIGAGLYLSAASNLRQLLSTNPGLLSVRFNRDLLPNNDRLIRNMDRLRENMSRDTQMGQLSGLLLAYLGYQTDDADAITDGFDAIHRITENRKLQPDPFYAILAKIWRD